MDLKVYSDQGVDRKRLGKLTKDFSLQVVHVGHYEQRLKDADEIPGVFMLGVSMLGGGDYLAGDDIEDINGIMKPSKHSDRFDIAHIYSAYHGGCQYFVTNNPKDFIREVRDDPNSNGKREQLEEVLKGMKVVTLDELEEILIARHKELPTPSQSVHRKESD